MPTYELLLKLYPSTFRARFGEEMTQYIRDETAHGRRVSWTRMLADLIGSALVQQGRDGNMRAKLAVAGFFVIVAGGGTLLAVGAGGESGYGFAALVLAVMGTLFGAALFLARRGKLGAEHDYAATTNTKHWWWIPAALIGVAEVLFSVGQLIQDPKKEHVFALVVLSLFAALIFGGMRVRDRRTSNWMLAAGVLPMLGVFWLIAPTIVALLVIVMAMADNIRTSRPAFVA